MRLLEVQIAHYIMKAATNNEVIDLPSNIIIIIPVHKETLKETGNLPR